MSTPLAAELTLEQVATDAIQAVERLRLVIISAQEQLGWSPHQLAHAAHLTPTGVRHLLSGQTPITIEAMVRLCLALDIRLEMTLADGSAIPLLPAN